MNDEMLKQAQAFQKMWAETFTKMAVGGLDIPASSPSPELFRQMRGAMFKAMAESWDQFLRSPEFLGVMKQSMENGIAVRATLNEFLNRAHHEVQGAAKDDVDSILAAIRHAENRTLEALAAQRETASREAARVAELEARVERLLGRLEALETGPARAKPAARGKKKAAAAAAERSEA